MSGSKANVRAIVSWVLYDLANTIFSMGVVSNIFPLWIRDQVGATRADAVYGTIMSVSMAIIFVVSPHLGAMTDRTRTRMPFLLASTLLCIGATALLGRVTTVETVICFVVANVMFQAGLQFYDALLPEVSTPETRGRIGGLGVGFGYVGSFIALGISGVLGIVNKPRLFMLYAVSFLLFSLPCFIFVRERGNPNPRPIRWNMIADTTRQLIRTFRESDRYPGLARFLIGRMFYTDAINTVITIMALYAVNVAIGTGLSEEAAGARAQSILLSSILFAILGGFFWGWLADRIGPKRTLVKVLQIWVGIFTVASCVGILHLPLWVMYVVAATAGFSLAGVWASDRPLMLRLTPPDRIGEFYGLYGMVGRFSAITGPAIWAGVTYVTNQRLGMKPHEGQGVGVFLLVTMILIGLAILRPVSDHPNVSTLN